MPESPINLCRIAVVLLACVFVANGIRAQEQTLTVIRLKHHEVNHPHRDTGNELRMLGHFARANGMLIRWLDAHQPADLVASLRAGEADLVAADLPPALSHEAGLISSAAMGFYTYHLIARATTTAANPLELRGMQVGVQLSSPLWPYFMRLEQSQPAVNVVALPADLSHAEVVAKVARGEFDAAAIPVRRGEHPLRGKPHLTTLFELSGAERIAWHFRQDAGDLRDRVNGFLHRYHASFVTPALSLGDIEAIKARRVLRVITRVDPQNYFLKRGKRAGFEYELVQLFTAQQGLGLEFLVADSEQQIVEWLRSGAGDVVTTRVNAERIALEPDLAQSRSYFHSSSVLVSRTGNDIHSHLDLHGKRVAVLANTVHHRALEELIAAGVAVRPVVVNPNTALTAVIEKIENWALDAAVVDAFAVDDVRAAHPLIQAGISLSTQFNYAWTVRDADRGLRDAIDGFMREQFRMETYNVLAKRYFGRSRFVQFGTPGRISPYDDLAQRYAEMYQFDWRLIVAQMYGESHFDPAAESVAGAQGLMQLLPATARAMGVADPFEPESAIRGGVKYLRHLWDRFSDDIPPGERTWFALAAYNVGYHRVERARQHAQATGLDPMQWFGHVENAIRAMSFDAGSDTGSCRCGQTVVYVRDIRSLYNTYHRLQETFTADSRAASDPGTIY